MTSSAHWPPAGEGRGHIPKPSDLPEPDINARAHSARLCAAIAAKMQQRALSFAEYMQVVLYEPGLGYYMAGAQKFGEHGDYVTAPEISPLFGQCLARQAQQVLALSGGDILELGAGSGKLAASLLSAMPYDAARRYLILEPSAELQYRQRQTIGRMAGEKLLQQVCWLDSLPTAFRGVILANEVMDALPVERFCIADTVIQLGCGLRPGSLAGNSSDFIELELPASAALTAAVRAIEVDMDRTLPPGYCSEVNLLLAPWLRSLADCLQQGVLLLIDYGYPRREYYLAERHTGTLACYYRHRMHHNVFHCPGLQDITSHVDFTRVAEVGSQCDLDLLGYTHQAAFLLALDLLRLAKYAGEPCRTDSQRLAITQAVKRLSLPGEMGERFQVMALGKNYNHRLQGFTLQDLSHRL